MAFLTVEQVMPLVGNNSDYTVVSRLLVQLKLQLQNMGLVFATPAAPSTWKLTLDDLHFSQSIFDFNLASNITSATIKSTLDSTYQTPLIIGTDCTLVEHYNLSGYFYRLQLINYRIRSKYNYLQLQGNSGLVVDFGLDTLTDLAQLIIACFVEYVIRYSLDARAGFRSIANTRLGDALTSYHANDISHIDYTNMLNSDCFSTLMIYISV